MTSETDSGPGDAAVASAGPPDPDDAVSGASVSPQPSGGEDRPYRMTLSLNVLNHLGLNLYSNLPAVLSEAVANAWDADATAVSVDIDTKAERIEIVDDGQGMTRDEINQRFLLIGYRRREDHSTGAGGTSFKYGREVMGRKGIGKLSLFSIAKTVEVHSIAARPLGDPEAPTERSGFIMDIDDIRAAIEQDEHTSGQLGRTMVYHPEPVPPDQITHETGTRIILTGLKKDPARTAAFLTRRLARRFSVISDGFTLTVDGQPVSPADRDLLRLARYVWVYGDDDFVAKVKTLTSDDAIVFVRKTVTQFGVPLSGWIAAARKSSDLKSAGEGRDHLNAVTIMVRDKLAQEDVLRTADQGGLFTKYLFGQLHADFLDLDDQDDIATSSRQSILEDDPRFETVTTFVRDELRFIQNDWNRLREEDGVDAARKIEAIDEWFKKLEIDDRKHAKTLFGKIHAIPGDDESRRSLYASTVLAFEGLRRRRRLELIGETDAANIPALISAFRSIDDIESASYYEIVRDRLGIIRKFEGLLEDDALEAVLHKFLFEHLWLLDPSWERTTVPIMEKSVKKIIEDPKNLTKEILDSRLDIAYRRSSTSHVIVELKRASVVPSTNDLLAQVSKYRQGVIDYLRDTEGKNVDLQIVIVVGTKGLSDYRDTDGKSTSRKLLEVIDARVFTYDRLVRDALATYEQYLELYREMGEVRELLSRIEDEIEESATDGAAPTGNPTSTVASGPSGAVAAEPVTAGVDDAEATAGSDTDTAAVTGGPGRTPEPG